MDQQVGLGVLHALLADSEPWVGLAPVRAEDGTVVDLEYVFANEAAESIVARGPLTGRRLLEIIPEARGFLFSQFARALESGQSARLRLPALESPSSPDWPSGWIAYDILSGNLSGDDGVVVVHWSDVTAEKVYEARLRALVENASDVVCMVDTTGTVVYVSPTAHRVLGRNTLHEQFDEHIHPEDAASVRATFADLMDQDTGTAVELDVRLRHADGRWLSVQARATNHVADQAVGGVVVNWHDNTRERELQERLRYQATHDVLTGLPNRRILDDHLELAVARTQRQSGLLALMFCDVDHFKRVNDALGHAGGDALLQEFARRLRSCVRPQDTVARVGGDEFVILCEDLKTHEEAEDLTERVHRQLRGTYRICGADYPVTVSIGLAVGRHPKIAREMLDVADRALYAVKKGGRDAWASRT